MKEKSKKTIVLLLVICATISICSGQNIEKGVQVKVMSYNIFHCEDENGVINLKNAAGVITKNSPDIVALQEVDRKTSRVNGKDLATELGYLTGLMPLYGAAID
ncbi:hypothetical protein [uncultured Draconibacterium sp.]|uniref:endonuclease/exonuclease/phosphatase family protein n=1 Tax=uncultured Draconibacterium sp. TaxID=1573823 RepID=UPI0029C6C389|nr:hypothetical protein [uncultured Draconibacterium sp.]